MKKIIDFIKKYWLFILLSALVAMFFVLWLSQRPKHELPLVPVPTPTAGVLPQPQSQFSQLLGEGFYYQILFSENEFAKFPPTLPVYRTKKFTKEEIVSHYAKITADLGFLVSPVEQQRPDEKYLVWQEEENYLGINISSGQLSFIGKSLLNTSLQGQILSSTQIQNLIRQRLIGWGLISEETKIETIEGFGVAGLELIPVKDLSQALVFRIFFSPEFDSFPLIGLGPAKNLIEAKVDNKGILLSLSFNLHKAGEEVFDNYPLKSFEETIKEIKEGKSQIVSVLTSKQEERSIPPRDQIQEIKISSIAIAYYETTEIQEFYQPVFLLKGNMTLKEGETLQASFILPAISAEYLKPLQEHFKP